MIRNIFKNDAITIRVRKGWWPTKGHRCHIAITKDNGIYSVVVLNLPGAGGCGDTVEEAIYNTEEATRAAIASYKSADKEIPWKKTYYNDVSPGSEGKWIVVNTH